MTPRADHGQAAVELALSLPVVLLALLAVVQVVVVAGEQVAVIHAAREAARAAAVAGDPVAAAVAAAPGFEVSASVTGTVVRVELSRRLDTDVPLVGRLVGDVVVRAEATMQLEPP